MGVLDTMFKKEKEEVTDTAEELAGEAGEQLASLEAELTEAKDQLLRRTAEMDNMRRRHEGERMQLIFEANKRLITDLLPTLDDLERTLSFVKPEEKNNFSTGVELVYKNFQKVLETYGVKVIESVGKPFDVHLHDALMEEVRDDIEPGMITTEVQKGYMMNDTVLRHAKVIVSKQAEAE
jgi:molecular chaperone GrpE